MLEQFESVCLRCLGGLLVHHIFSFSFFRLGLIERHVFRNAHYWTQAFVLEQDIWYRIASAARCLGYIVYYINTLTAYRCSLLDWDSSLFP